MSIREELLSIKKKIIKLYDSEEADSLTETETRKLLIDPFVQALGYDPSSLDQVRLGWRGGKGAEHQKEADYALFIKGSGKPCIIIEAKRLRNELTNNQVANQALMYAFLNGVAWCILTNGNRISILDAFDRKRKDRALFPTFDLQDLDTEDGISSERAAQLLSLLTPDSISGKKFVSFRKKEYARNDVVKMLSGLIVNADPSIVRLLRKRFKKEYTAGQISSALASIKFMIDTDSTVPGKPEMSKKGRKRLATLPKKSIKRPKVKLARSVRWAKSDTIICPAHEEGFNEVFLGKKQWYAIRLRKARIPYIKYIAIYRIRPVRAITHYGKVKSIELCTVPEYEGEGKYHVYLKGRPIEIDPVKIKPTQSTTYANLAELLG